MHVIAGEGIIVSGNYLLIKAISSLQLLKSLVLSALGTEKFLEML